MANTGTKAARVLGIIAGIFILGAMSTELVFIVGIVVVVIYVASIRK